MSEVHAPPMGPHPPTGNPGSATGISTGECQIDQGGFRKLWQAGER